jgi:hypothetical protein
MASPSENSSTYKLIEDYAKCGNNGGFLTFTSMLGIDNYKNRNQLLQEGFNQFLYTAQFYAFLSEFSKQFSSSWDSQQYYGHADPIVGYKNTRRTISLSWQAPSENAQDAKQNLLAAEILASMLYPGYRYMHNGVKVIDRRLQPNEFEELFINEYGMAQSPGFNKEQNRNFTQEERLKAWSSLIAYIQDYQHEALYQRGNIMSHPPLIGLQWANLIRGRDRLPLDKGKFTIEGGGSKINTKTFLLGFIENYTYSVDTEMGFFSDGTNLFPKVLTLSCNFVVQHQHTVGRKDPLW